MGFFDQHDDWSFQAVLPVIGNKKVTDGVGDIDVGSHNKLKTQSLDYNANGSLSAVGRIKSSM